MNEEEGQNCYPGTQKSILWALYIENTYGAVESW